jgi:hypothetical protein
VKPVLQALVLADRVYQDVSGKKIIAGTFSRYNFSKKPPISELVNPDGTKKKVLAGGMSIGSPYAYLSLTDLCEGTKLQIQFLNLSKNLVLFGNELTIDKVDRLRNVEIVLPLPVLPIMESGTYALEGLCEGEVLGSWRILAENIDEKKEEKDDDTNSI